MPEATEIAQAGSPQAGEVRPKRLTKHVRAQQLLDIAEELFATRGYEATSIEEIARAAGVTRPIIYEHFGSLEGVLLACVERALAAYKRALAEAVQSANPAEPNARIERGSDVFFSLIERDPKRWVLLFSNTMALSGAFAERLAALRFATIDLIVDLVRAYAPQASEERLRACGYAIAGTAMHLGYWWLHNPEVKRERILAYYRDFIVGGIGGLLAGEASDPQ